jgi:ribosomal protein L11 methyltransferase
MDWAEIKIKIPTEYTESAAAIANVAVPYGIYIEDYSDLEQGAEEIAHINLIDEELLKSDRTHSIIHLYISKENNVKESVEYLTERLTCCNIPYILSEESISEQEWANNWKQFFKCTEIGNRLCIRPCWEEYDNKDNRKVLSIDPGAAFGTGTHATTSMCLELLDEMVTDGQTILDIGSGSGILSIAGVLLGAKNAIGVDIDPVAVKVAKENAAMNGIEDKAKYIVGNLNEEISDKFDIVVANIVADVIISLSKDVKNLMVDDGVFICSGIIDVRADEVESALVENGLKIIKRIENNNWVAFLSKKN